MASKKIKKAAARKAYRPAARHSPAGEVHHSPEPASQPAFEHKPIMHHFHGIMPRKTKSMVVGTWALILSIIAAVTLALAETPYLALILVAVGFIVGFMNFEHEETVKFMTANICILVVAAAVILTGMSRIEMVSPVIALYLQRAAYNTIAVVAPAAFVISMKALKELAD